MVVTPATATIGPGATLPLTATVSGASDTSVTWSIQEGSAGGVVSATSVYTAPAATGTYHIIATSVSDPSRSAMATIAVKVGGVGAIIE